MSGRCLPLGQRGRELGQSIEGTDTLDHPGGLAGACPCRSGDDGLRIGAQAGELSYRFDLQAIEHATHPGDGRQRNFELAASGRHARRRGVGLPHQPRQLAQFHAANRTEVV